MPPKPRLVLQPRDDLAWERSDEVFDEWEATLHNKAMYHAIGTFILKHRPGEAVELHKPIMGGYNIFYRLEYKDGSSAALRVPSKGIVQFPEEKVRYEVATMRYVAAHTTIPVPRVYHYGTAAENPTGLGPFIIMDFVNHDQTMSHALNDPSRGIASHHRLDPDISEEKLEFLYRQMADIVLQLSTLTFPRIGSLVEDDDGVVSVEGRPLIQNTNSLVDHARVPPWVLPSKTYTEANEWYSALADMHLAQLVFQHNDAVEDEDDARDKYVARQLFRKLAVEGRLAAGLGGKPDPDGTFRLWSEDLRPSNVLIDRHLRVVAVVDWEFAYVAPSQFTFDPPWWLLLGEPDWWEGGYQMWMRAFEPRLRTFLRVLEDEERKLTGHGLAVNDVASTPLAGAGDVKTPAQRMRESWDTRSWMVNFASRRSWSFDGLFWRYLDPAYFGPNEEGDHKARLGLLSAQETRAMEPFIRAKLEEANERVLVEWKCEKATAHLAKVLF
ncbi:Altered inheritance of mitochondria protein 9 [Colletotrichum shisoi]|uniref:Altered inheritance of mitochondria protein 9 n=1 Tax=Colletotrichum shisoi TaxID=2078593 RepID=A0A5Q4C7V3_9PEZI|nr:Altered inheritance of mitochondria protein 9 [Colletotrichum shisoi]